MKQFEITSRLPNIRGEPLITVHGVLRIQPFTPRSVSGKTYWITKAEVSVRTAFGSSTRTMGIIFDKVRGWEFALSIKPLVVSLPRSSWFLRQTLVRLEFTKSLVG